MYHLHLIYCYNRLLTLTGLTASGLRSVDTSILSALFPVNRWHQRPPVGGKGSSRGWIGDLCRGLLRFEDSYRRGFRAG